jgi:hypothetical protein
MTRLETSVHCILVACDRSLARRGEPLFDNLTAQEKLRRLGFRAVSERALYPAQNRGDVYECTFVHPDCGFAVAYIEEQWADGRFWRFERAPLPPRRPAVFRFDYRLGIHAPEVTDADALSLVPEGDDAFVVRFYSERFLKDRRLPKVEGFCGDPVSPDVEPYAVCAAYRTNNWGEVRGQAYVIACRFTGRRDAEGRRIFADPHGEFVLGGEAGSPECPARFWLCEPALED